MTTGTQWLTLAPSSAYLSFPSLPVLLGLSGAWPSVSALVELVGQDPCIPGLAENRYFVECDQNLPRRLIFFVKKREGKGNFNPQITITEHQN